MIQDKAQSVENGRVFFKGVRVHGWTNMLQETIAFDALSPRQEAGPCAPGSASDIASGLVGSLRDLGFAPGLLEGGTGITAGGAEIQVWPRQTLRSDTATEHFLRRLAGLIYDDVPVTLSLKELGPDDCGIDVLERFCLSIRRFLGADRALLSQVGLSLHSHQIPMQAYLLVSRTLLGSGPRYVILDSLQMKHHKDSRVQEVTEKNWSFLWRQRDFENRMLPAYGAGVRTGCPLLGDEAAEALLPLHGIQVPAGSAWLPIGVNLPHFADDKGQIDWPLLQSALESCIDLGDQLLDVINWPTACQRSDALLNRRLAIVVSGVGDLVRLHGNDPGCLKCLQWVDAIMKRVRKTLWDRSHVIAGQTGLLPALARADPSAGLCDHSHRQNWQRRWHLALASSAVRHRNLLVMSPYSVLPEGGEESDRFIDLLPILVHADAYAFAGQPRLSGWNLGHFKRFHTRAWAVMQQLNARPLNAAGV